MIRPLTLLTIVAAAGAGLHVYNTKHAVSLLDRELRAIARDIGEAEARTQALKAEWFWATEQERLRGLVQRHLALEPMQPTQFVRFAEAERRLPTPAADDGPAEVLFPPREAAAESGAPRRIALLPPERPVAAPAAAPSPVAPPLSAPVLAAVANAALAAAADALPLPAPAAPEPRSANRTPVVFVPPPPPAARHAEPRPAETRAPEPRPAAVAEIVRPAPPVARRAEPRPVEARAPEPRPAAAIVELARAAPPPRPATPRPAPEATSAPAAPRPPATTPAATQVAVAAVPRAPEGATVLGSFGSTLGGGSALGTARAALPPPVAFGSALR